MSKNTYYLELMFILLIRFTCRNWWKKHTVRNLFFRRKDKSPWKKLGYEFTRINTTKRYDEDYEIGRIQTFITKFKKKQLKKSKKESNKKIKELEDETKKLKLKLTSQIPQ